MEIFNKILLTLNFLWLFFIFLGVLAANIMFNGDVKLWMDSTKEDSVGVIYYKFMIYLTLVLFFSILYWPIYLVWRFI